MMKEKLRHLVFWGFELSKVALILGIITLLFHYFVVTVFVIEGASMEPAFKDKEVVLMERFSYLIKKPKRGEVVILKFPGRPREKYIKRIVGLPKETIEIKNGLVYINGERLKEEYLPFGVSTTPELKKTLSEKEYFVLGDNRENSNDSRIWGACPQGNLIGKAIFVLWPLSSWKLVVTPYY